MKTSNIFLLIALIPIFGSFLGPKLFSEYVSKDEYDQNLAESIKSLETPTYRHKTETFAQSFNRILIKNTQTKQTAYLDDDTYKRNTAYNQIRWIQSATCGLKLPYHNDFIQRSSIENNTLVIYTSYPNKLPVGTITVYSPSLSHMTIENTGMVRLTNTVTDSLIVTATRSHLEIDEQSSFNKLAIVAGNNSKILVRSPYIGEARYNVYANSKIRNEIDSCDAMYIHGDSGSHVAIVPYSEEDHPARNTYQYLRFNNELGNIRIENTRIHRIVGNKARLNLNMSAQQIEQTLAALVDE